jgi:hypothetical protein
MLPLESIQLLVGVRGTHRLSFQCCVVVCFVCLRPVSCVPNDSSVAGLSFLIAPSVFSNVYLLSIIFF